MRDYSVFDVAHALIQRAQKRELQAVKLQKLVFYTFGWHGYLSGSKLFDEVFYAMPRGPVVGELLSAHAGISYISSQHLVEQMEEREEGGRGTDPFFEALIDAIWAEYGPMSPRALEDLSHLEDPWLRPWEAREPTQRRADMSATEIVQHFLGKRQVPLKMRDLLPPRQVVTLDSSEYQLVEDCYESSLQSPVGLSAKTQSRLDMLLGASA